MTPLTALTEKKEQPKTGRGWRKKHLERGTEAPGLIHSQVAQYKKDGDHKAGKKQVKHITNFVTGQVLNVKATIKEEGKKAKGL